MAASGLAWHATAYLLGRAVILAATITLARVLTPSEFGVVSVAIVVIGFFEVIADFGVSQALIYLPASRQRNDAALLCSLISGAVFAALVAGFAGPLADALGSPESAPLLQVLSVSLVLTSLGLVPDMLLRRDLQFRRRLAVQLAMGGTRGVVTIALALSGLGVWALVFGYIAGQLAYSFVAWIRVTYRPSTSTWRPKSYAVKDVLGYGLPVALSGVLTTLVVNVDYVVVSRVLGPEALGVYTLAFRLPEMIIIGVFQVVSGVTFPVYRRASEQPGRLRNAYLRVLQLQAAYGLIVGFGLASVAPLVVPLLFGQVWEAAVLPMQALAIYAALRSLGLGVVDLLKATGRPNATLLLAACRLVVLLPALLIGAQFGIEGVAWAQVAVALSFALVMQGIAGRVVHAGVLDLSKACAPPVLAGGSTALVALGVDRLLEASQPISLLASVLAGAAVAAMTLLVVSSQLRADATGLLHRLRRRSSPRQAPGA